MLAGLSQTYPNATVTSAVASAMAGALAAVVQASRTFSNEKQHSALDILHR